MSQPPLSDFVTRCRASMFPYLFPIIRQTAFKSLCVQLRRARFAHFFDKAAAIVPLACSERDAAARMLR